jgi:hypothetical protein
MVRLLLLLVAILAPLVFGQSTDTVTITRPSQIVPPQRPPASSGCSPDRRTDPNAGVLISEVIFEGPTISSSELSTVKSQLAGACFDEQSEVIEQYVHDAFADRGFAQAEVNVTLKASDALAVPKPVTLKADVTEGPRFHMGEIRFVDNHAFSMEKLRAAFPIKRGDVFQRPKIVSGLTEIRKLYTRHGYSDLVFVPGIAFSSTGTAALKITISEGPQYRMGELKIYAKKEIVDHLASEWQLREGVVFNLNYPQTFIDKSHFIPSGFSRQNIRLVRNCPDATIAVLLIVDQTDPKLQTPPKDVPCEKPEGGAY